MAKDRLIFLHVPRTSGSTLHGVMKRQYRKKRLLTIELLGPDGMDPLAALPVAQRADVRLLKGHVPFGVHAHLPGPSRYFSMTREPSERIVSLYHYMRRNEAHVDHEKAMSVDLDEFIGDDRWRMHTDNSFVRFIAGDLHAPRGAVDKAMLGRAISNIEQHYFTTGSDRYFDESLVLLKRAYGWRDDIVYRRQNVNPNRPALEGLGDRVGRLLERWTELDRELVAFCDDRLRRTIDDQPDDFHREVAALKAAVASPGEPPRPGLISRVVSRVR